MLVGHSLVVPKYLNFNFDFIVAVVPTVTTVAVEITNFNSGPDSVEE